MEIINFSEAITEIARETPNLKWPHNTTPFSREEYIGGAVRYGIVYDAPDNEKEWLDYDYNPPEFMPNKFPEADGSDNLRPKPTWEQIRHASRLAALRTATWRTEYAIEDNVPAARKKLSDETPLTHGDSNFHLGDGINHMTGLLQMVEQANAAGAPLPHIVLRTADHAETPMFTREDTRAFLAAVAARENAVESAHNLLMSRYHAFAKIRDDESNDLTDRESAAESAKNIADNYETELASEIANYNPDKEPEDLPTLKRFLIEGLEAAANAHIKHLKGVVSQQGYDLPPACDDAENAEKKVATLASAGSREIEAATTIEDAKAEYEKAKTRIAAVKALNSPTFHLRGHTAELPSPAKFAKRTLQLTIKQPAELTIGRVTWLVSITDGQANVTQTRQTTHEIDVDVEIQDAATMEFTSRNICGVSELTLTLTPPAEEAEGT